MKQEILTLEQGQVADMLLSLKNSHRRINRFLQDYTPPLNGDRYLTDKEKEHYTPPSPVSAKPDADLTHAKNLIREFLSGRIRFRARLLQSVQDRHCLHPRHRRRYSYSGQRRSGGIPCGAVSGRGADRRAAVRKSGRSDRNRVGGSGFFGIGQRHGRGIGALPQQSRRTPSTATVGCRNRVQRPEGTVPGCAGRL